VRVLQGEQPLTASLASKILDKLRANQTGLERNEFTQLRDALAEYSTMISAAANGKPARVTAIFHGPDAYVSPSWYLNRQSVPTWNYLVVHAHGTVAIRHDSADKEEILKALIDTHDPPYRAHWSEVLSEEFRERQKAAIVGFEIAVDRIEAKFKLSQNRPAADRERVLSALAAGKSNDRAVADWMKRIAQSAA